MRYARPQVLTQALAQALARAKQAAYCEPKTKKTKRRRRRRWKTKRRRRRCQKGKAISAMRLAHACRASAELCRAALPAQQHQKQQRRSWNQHQGQPSDPMALRRNRYHWSGYLAAAALCGQQCHQQKRYSYCCCCAACA